jgi:hypothetical protein
VIGLRPTRLRSYVAVQVKAQGTTKMDKLTGHSVGITSLLLRHAEICHLPNSNLGLTQAVLSWMHRVWSNKSDSVAPWNTIFLEERPSVPAIKIGKHGQLGP